MSGLGRYKTETFNAKTLIKAEVIIKWRMLQELNTRSYYLLLQYALKQGNSPSLKGEKSDEANINKDWAK